MSLQHDAQNQPRPVSADSGTLISTFINLWPSIWPGERPDLQRRVIGTFALLLLAKLATIVMPFTFKWATDALSGQGSAPVAADAVPLVASNAAT